ncbi:MAG TPA: hypothetical protein PKD91_14230, partial [Bacteroidia bacterium]|nr:hypothetical protein [Bacteroidia bacterium]
EIAANAIINIVTAVFILIFLQFVSIAAALGLGVVFGEAYLGFLAVAGFYGLIGLIIMATKDKWLKINLVNNIIKSLYGPKNEN